MKNRFANIFPCKYIIHLITAQESLLSFAMLDDSSRVVLPAIADVEGSDYINACTIDVSRHCLQPFVVVVCFHLYTQPILFAGLQ